MAAASRRAVQAAPTSTMGIDHGIDVIRRRRRPPLMQWIPADERHVLHGCFVSVSWCEHALAAAQQGQPTARPSLTPEKTRHMCQRSRTQATTTSLSRPSTGHGTSLAADSLCDGSPSADGRSPTIVDAHVPARRRRAVHPARHSHRSAGSRCPNVGLYRVYLATDPNFTNIHQGVGHHVQRTHAGRVAP